VTKETRKTIRIELTDDQRKKVRDQLGQDVESVELRVEQELEQRTTPISMGTFF
jgi:hypothetical protein